MEEGRRPYRGPRGATGHAGPTNRVSRKRIRNFWAGCAPVQTYQNG